MTGLENIGLGTGAGIALLGYCVVFLGIVLLMIVVMVMSRIMIASTKKAAASAPAAPAAEPEVKAAQAPAGKPAPGTAGELKLYDTAPADAAMIMAIVAEQLGKPLNELRFVSIREIKEEK